MNQSRGAYKGLPTRLPNITVLLYLDNLRHVGADPR
jgi:hypothetical protein